MPKSVEFRSELPLAFTGKVLRRVLAEEELAAADQLGPQGNTSID